MAHASAVVVIGGVQAIVPGLPAIQQALGLSDSQIGLVNSAYLLPGVLIAIPAGFLVDRIGRRWVYSGFLAVFGVAALGLLMGPSFEILLVLRAIQGVAFGAVLPLSITLVGDLLSGPAQVREQGWRIVALTGSDTIVPLISGALVTLAWHAPFAINALALPLAVLGWIFLDPMDRARQTKSSKTFHLSDLGMLLRTRLAISLQSLGMLRFFFRFAALTYGPIMMSQRGAGTALISISLAAMAAAGVAAAVSTRPLLRRTPATNLLVLNLGLMASGFVVVALATDPRMVALAFPLFGLAEGYYGVVLNAMSLEGVTSEQRATFVATMGALRNLGKFLAPALMGLALLWISLSAAFLIVSVLAAVSWLLVAPLRSLDDNLR